MKIRPTISRIRLLASIPFAVLTPMLFASKAIAQVEAPAKAPSKAPNILLVLSDDQSARFVGCYGDSTIRTPNIDGFAREGIRFDRAYVTSPQCVPSRASIMTGKSPVALDMTRFSAALPAEHISYPELLRSGANYYTGICGRTFHLDGPGGANMPPETRKVFKEHELATFKNRVDYLRTGDRIQALVQMKEFLDGRPADKPWFLQVGFNDPHRPFDENSVTPPQDPAKLKLPPFMPDTPALRRDLAQYYDEVTRLDEDFGRVLKTLDEHGQTSNTLVIFMGDNGAALLRGKGTLYEIGVRVPLIARWPNVIQAGSSNAIVSGEDLAPTFIQAAGVEVPSNITGQSFLPLLRGQAFEPRRFAFSERGAHASSLPNSTQDFDLGRCAISSTHKLIYNVLWQLPYTPVDFNSQPFWKEIKGIQKEGKLSQQLSELYFPPARPMFEVYDLQNDPEELNNLAGKPEVAAIERELKAAMQEKMILDRDYVPLPLRGDKN